ncbi:DUF177 domain-containing protein [Pseudooceanicola sp. CBS1P-1]|uniref:DUF177 domain-containing protein n=1 Tax=Pseudooceanicola albus TaxID=2692189 RepID=A0A6L7FW09_9RHOB|nr:MULTISPECIES: YceD family protein [Pseudooceanicola]MBT9383384.1 DUF177 domain-containing protein [Pseudooceanicola endophyticus]MXN16294.1 DUF177 domain-containing protein [Pseudooceanicola albus]
MTGFSDLRLAVAELARTRPTPFEIRPAKPELEALAGELELLDLRKLSFTGTLRAVGKKDWLLEATLGATVVQPCSVTLKPVTTRLDEPVTRRFTPVLPDELSEEEEVEMPEDETLEKLGSHIDPGAVMAEALALLLPLYPRAEDAALDEANFTEPGQQAMTDEDAKPFAGLGKLMALKGGKDTPEDGTE